MEHPWRDKETLERLYWDEGLSIEEVGGRLGCGHNTVHRWLQRTGVGTRTAKQDEPPLYRTDEAGYERWRHTCKETQYAVQVHRLVAVAEYGIDTVFENDVVHHKNHIQWDNRPSNLEPLSTEEHIDIHSVNIDDSTLRDYVYQEGLSAREIAEREDCSRQTVWKKLHQSPVRHHFSLHHYHCILQYMIDSGHSISDIGDELGVEPSTAQTYLSERGVEGWQSGPTTVHDKYDEDTLRRLYFDEQLSFGEIGDRIGVSQGAVSQIFDKMGIETGEPTSEPDQTPWRDEGWLRYEYLVADKSINQISRELDCGRSTISKWVSNHGLKAD